MSWTEKTFCTHGVSFSEPCDYCEIVGLKETLEWMTRSVKRNEKRLVELQQKIESRMDDRPSNQEQD
jgi:hypothetical protein